MAEYRINEEQNGIEVIFEEKPEAGTLDALKASGFRWHRVKKLWYAKNTESRMALVQSIATGQKIESAPKAAKVDMINLDNLGENRPTNFYGADLAMAIREDLKRRGVSGVTVRARRVTHDTGITVTIKATAEDFASVEEAKNRMQFSSFYCQAARHGVYTGKKWVYNLDELTEEQQQEEYNNYILYHCQKAPQINEHHLIDCRNDYFTITTAFYNKIVAVFKIANQWNWNRSDSMTDYFDIGYFLDIEVKAPETIEPRQTMTDAERDAYDVEIAEKEAREAAQMAEWERQQEESRRLAEEAEKARQESRKIIDNNITVEDLTEEKQIFVEGLAAGIGKESTLSEVHKTFTEYGHTEDALISRKVTFATREAFEAFAGLLLDDFDFLAGMGGTGTEDSRMDGIELYQLTEDQRKSIKWNACNCIGIYVDGKLEMVCNPEGYNYSRYTYYVTDSTTIRDAQEATEEQRKEAETKPAFYFPAPVEEQAAWLSVGQDVTIYQCDGWMLNSIYAGAGTITAIRTGKYAQYSGVYITLLTGRKSKEIFIRNGKNCLIYDGIKPALPDSLTREQVTPMMYKMFNASELFPKVIEYYEKQGFKPLLDTIQR